MPDEEFESRILRFEQAWRLRRPARDRGLPGTSILERPSPGRYRLLVELICIDLEFRWRNPGVRRDRPRWRSTSSRFPELVSLDRLPLELIGEEYRVRCRWGDRPSHAEFLSRFHERREQIQAELLRIDARDRRRSRPSLAPHSRPASRNSPSGGPADPIPEVLLLSHHDFLLRRLIGAGRMGKVYEARQHGDGT